MEIRSWLVLQQIEEIRNRIHVPSPPRTQNLQRYLASQTPTPRGQMASSDPGEPIH